MAVDKSLKFSFVLDQTSFNSVKKALDELIEKSRQLAKALGGTGMGGLMGVGQVGNTKSPSQLMTSAGGAAAPQAFSKVVLDNANAFKNMANVGSGALKGLTDAMRRAVSEQSQEVDRLQRKLNSLGEAYAGGSAGVSKFSKTGRLSTVGHEQIVKAKAEYDAAQSQLQQLQSATQQQTGGAPGAPGVPGQAGARGGMGWLSPIAGGNINLANPAGMLQQLLGSTGLGAVLMRSAGLIGTGAMGVVNQGIGWNNAMGNNLAARGDVMNPMINRIRRGDMSDMMKMQYIRSLGPEQGTELMRSADSAEVRAMAGVSGAWDTMKGLVSGGPGLTALTDQALETKNAERYQAMMETAGRSVGYQQGMGRALGYEEETRGERLMASRLFGRGFNRDKKTGTWKDSFSDFKTRVEMQGLDLGEYGGATVTARNLGGLGFANQYAGSIAGASAAGYDVSGLLAGAARGGGGNAGAMRLARGAMGGGIATGAGLQLGQALYGFDPRSMVSGEAALKAAQSVFDFTGGPEDFNKAQMIQMGMAGGDQLARGFDPYQQGRNIVSAIGAMPGASSYAQESLASKSSFKELLALAGGETSLRSRAYGYGKEEAKQQLEGMAGSVFDRFVDQGGTDDVSKAIRAMRASGMSTTDYLAQLSKTKGGQATLGKLGVYAADEMGLDTQGGVGLMGMLGGVKDLDKKLLKEGALPYGAMDEDEKQRREQEAKTREENKKMWESFAQDITKALKDSTGFAQTQKTFGEGGSIDNLREAIEKLTNVLEGKGSGSTTIPALKTAGSFWGGNPGLNPTPSTGAPMSPAALKGSR